MAPANWHQPPDKYWLPASTQVRDRVEQRLEALGLTAQLGLPLAAAAAAPTAGSGRSPLRCTGCLLNRYPTARHYIPWHADTVTDHGEAKVVATVSLGAPRQFELRRFPAGEASAVLPAADLAQLMAPGSLTLMAGNIQDGWQHRVPAPPKAEPDPGCRISLTFRSMLPEPERPSTTPVLP